MARKKSFCFDQTRYRAFISYSHQDDRWAAWLHKVLESYSPPKYLVGKVTDHGPVPGRLTPVFRDREELPSATNLGEVLNQALVDSACQIVICSPAAARSRWVNEEILTFKRLGGEHRIYCLIVGGEPNASDMPGQEDQECFPNALRFKLGVDGNLTTERTEPIAADARENKDGKGNAKLKLLAGMLGVGFDELAQRELHRRHQRMIAVATASIVGMLITSGLAIAALVAREEAEQQRERAEIEAETAQQTTNFLVELFEVSDPSEALGNTITAREILDRGARRIEFELTDQPAIQSNLMDTIGTVYRSLGLYTEARTLLERGLSTRRQIYGDNHTEVAHSESNIAELLGLQADFEDAVQMYQQAIATLRALPVSNNADIANSLSGLAQVYTLQGDFSAAEEQLRQAIRLQRITPDTRSLALAHSLDQLGMSIAFQSRPDEAEPLLRQALAMRQQLAPEGIHPDLYESLNNLAVFLYEQGRYDESEQLLREALVINQRLLGEDHPETANSLNNLAFVLHDADEYEQAEIYFQQALDIWRSKLSDDHPTVARGLNNLSFLYYDLGDFDKALEYSRESLATYRRVYPGDHPDVAYGLQNLAGWLVEQGEYETAEGMLTEALAMNQRIFPDDHPDIAITRSGIAYLMLETDQPEQALQLALAANEYLTTAYGDDHWRTAWARSMQGAALTALQRFDEAEILTVPAYESLKNNSAARPAQVRDALQRVVELYEAWDRPNEAQRYREQVSLAESD